MRVDKISMRRRIDQRAIIVLTMNFDQRRANGAQGLRRGRLIVDKGAGATVRRLNASQHQFVVADQSEFPRGKMRRVIARQIERRRDLSLFAAGAHQRCVATTAERQHEGVEQDRLAGAGLAGERGQTRLEIKIERVDKHDVTNGKSDQHRSAQDRVSVAIRR